MVIELNDVAMVLMNSVIGLLAFVFGMLLLFSYDTLKSMSDAMNKFLFEEDKFKKYRYSLGIIMVASSASIFWGVFYILSH